MPPLVDAPPTTAQPQTQESMMSSFDFTGVSFTGVAPFTPTLVYAPDPDAELDVETTGRGRGRGSKAAGKRAPSYIPRPPNAFMLFRADFVRQKHVPGSIETNHGSLSKIIGASRSAQPRCAAGR